jgi:hypothetical protein
MAFGLLPGGAFDFGLHEWSFLSSSLSRDVGSGESVGLHRLPVGGMGRRVISLSGCGWESAWTFVVGRIEREMGH